MAPQVLTLKKVKAAARRAYKARTLAAQHPRATKRACHYDIGGAHNCAIGAALTKTTLKRIAKAGANSGVLSYIAEKELVELPFDAHSRAELRAIQGAHDEWCNSSRGLGARHEETIRMRERFLRTIQP